MKSYILLPFILLTFLFACNEKVLSSGQNDLNIKDAFTQKEIPGESKATIRDYLKLFLELKQPNIVITEVLFRNRTYAINSSQKRLRLDLSAGTIANNKKSLSANEAMIYYTIDDKKYVVTVRNIVAKKPIYLP